MSPEAMSKLADMYTTSSGLIDYLSCFRNYLTSMVTVVPPDFKSMVQGTSQRELRALHPWEFDYKREKGGAAYWSQASSMPREVKREYVQPVVAPSPMAKSTDKLTPAEIEAVLQQYAPKVLATCAKCYDLMQPAWKEIKNEFKRQQVNSQRGSILTTNFYSILDTFSVRPARKEMEVLVRAFRGMGMQDVVKYDEFLRVCVLAKKN